MSDPLDAPSEEELAAIIITEIAALEADGVRLPGVARSACQLPYLDSLITIALRQLGRGPEKAVDSGVSERGILILPFNAGLIICAI